MAKAGRGQTRRDSKRRVLRPGESIRADGKYQYKYHIDGKPHFVYSWKLEPTDKLPKGKKPCLSLRELEKQVKTDLDMLVNIVDGQMTVCELVDRYLKTKTGVGQSTKQGYVTVQRLLAKEAFGKKTIRTVKTSDAKLFLIKLQQEDGKSYSSIHTIRGVLRPAFQMAVDDDILVKNPFGFQLAGVLVNDAVTREAITKDQMRKFLKFVHDDVVYCKYYEVVYILFHTGMRISDDDDKIRLNQRKPSKYKGLRRFGPEKNLQRINKFMKERPIFYKNLIQMKENIRFYLRCFYCITKVMILQFNSENRTELARNG